jgi:hypothetical protein
VALPHGETRETLENTERRGFGTGGEQTRRGDERHRNQWRTDQKRRRETLEPVEERRALLLTSSSSSSSVVVGGCPLPPARPPGSVNRTGESDEGARSEV